MRNLTDWLKCLEGRMPPIRGTPIWPPEFAERLAMASFGAHEAVLSRTGDNVLAIKAMTLWAGAYEADLRAGNDTPRPELAVFSDLFPGLDDDEENREQGRVELGPEAAAALDALILEAQTHPFDPADVAWMEETTRAAEAHARQSSTAPFQFP